MEERPQWGVNKPKTPPRPTKENEDPQPTSGSERKKRRHSAHDMRAKLRARKSVEKPQPVDEEAERALGRATPQNAEGVVGKFLAVELRKPCGMAHSDQSEQRRDALRPRNHPQIDIGPRSPTLPAHQARGAAERWRLRPGLMPRLLVWRANVQLLRRDPLCRSSDVLLKQKHSSEPKDSSPAGVGDAYG